MTEVENYLYKIIWKDSTTSEENKREERKNIDYMREGIIDSFGIISMIAMVEEEYEIDLPADFLISEEIRTIERFGRYIEEVKNEL